MDEEDYTMNIRKIVAASAIALTFGLVATAQAGNIDHVTADTNPAVFGTTGSAYMSTAQVMNVDHITEQQNRTFSVLPITEFLPRRKIPASVCRTNAADV